MQVLSCAVIYTCSICTLLLLSLVDWEQWNGILEWNTGLEYCLYEIKLIQPPEGGVLIQWNGLVEWNSGMEYWNGASEGIPYQDHPAHYSGLMEWEYTGI